MDDYIYYKTSFFTLLRAVVDKNVPQKCSPLHFEPVWFNSDSRKMTKKQRILSIKPKKKCDPYDDHKQCLDCRRKIKKAMCQIKERLY